MHFFITGGTGLIGRHLCRLLLSHNHKITVLSRQCANRVQALCGDTVNAVNHCHEISPQAQIDVIVNLAGEPIADKRWTPARKKLLSDSRLVITRQVVELVHVLKPPPELIISGSATGYYADQGNTILVESSPAAKGFSHDLCVEWEQAAQNSLPESTRLCLLRTGLVLSKQGGLLKKILPVFQWGGGGQLGPGTQWMPWIDINDMVNIILWLVSHTAISGPVNAVSPNPATNHSFTQALGRILSRPALLPLPKPIVKLAFGEMSELFLNSQRVLPEKLLHSGFTFQFDYLDSALAYELKSN